jgi:hypothetical protein
VNDNPGRRERQALSQRGIDSGNPRLGKQLLGAVWPDSSILTQMTTKSGTNQIHGSLFEYHTDNKLTARNVFQNTPNPITGRIIPVSRRNEFGGSVGLPIRKDHTFVFASYDQLKSAQAFSGTYTVETPDFTNFMQANFPNNIATSLLTNYPAAVGASGAPITVADEMTTLGLGTCTGTNAIGMPCDMPLFQPGVLSTSTPRDGIQWNVRVDQIFGSGSNRLYANMFRMTASQSSPVRVQTSIRIRLPRPTTRP